MMETDSEAQFVVGIDLGTTNSAVGYIDMLDEMSSVETFALPQLVAPGTVEARNTLPSFHYEPASNEFEVDALALPWDAARKTAVGILAREHGAGIPGRLSVSAKSWLSHSGVDRNADLLPWHSAPDVEKLPPGEVSRRYLEHIRQAWDHAHPDQLLAEQDLVLTVPASFDEVARELTVDAARKAGLPRVCLLEEPQAAFYAWLNEHRETDEMESGQSVLVCDVGGGTTDLTLIEVEEKDDALEYRRIAVGEHLLLGGDNLDLALAHHAEEQLGGSSKLSPTDWSILVRRCQQAKEILLGHEAPATYTLNLPARGRSVIGSSRQVTLECRDVVRLLADGFLPEITADEMPETRQSGFQEFGLPYAPDAGISRYVRAFLKVHGDVRPDHILFNGGFFESPLLRDRLLEVMRNALAWNPNVLRADRLDLAVAYGAAEYGRVRRGQGTRITGGLARTYYLGVGQDGGAPSAICLLPAGLEEGQTIQLTDRTFNLHIRKPVEFPLFTSSIRTQDKPGDLIPIDEETMRPMPSIKTVVNSGKKKNAETIAVQLNAHLTEIGTIEVWLAEKSGSGNREWRLQFDARAATQTERAVEEDTAHRAGLIDEAIVQRSTGVIQSVLAPGRKEDPAHLLKRLEEITETPRDNWAPALLRRWCEQILPLGACRATSPVLEARWLNLLGYALRPGYGFTADDWQISNVWRIKQAGPENLRNEMCRAEWWILWRRIAGGLTENQQLELANPLIKQWSGRIRNPANAKPSKQSGFLFGDHESAEVWRLLGSLERLPVSKKEQLGDLLLTWIERKGAGISNGAAVWALGRIGARVPAYGPLNTVVSAEKVEAWAEQLINLPGHTREMAFGLMHMARRTDDRYRDLSDETREKVLDWLTKHNDSKRLIALIRDGGLLDAEEQDHTFGETLPPGLHLAG